ncbi:MAG: cobyric acid synthase [Chloroflexi bacterium]|nr:cobyric acid synthase [Chloroflexota bacterium]
MGATIMVQGTASSVGKSVIAAGLCRIFLQDGMSVAPFKGQNMSNNSFVTPDGAEIWRAQAMQAAACRLAPSSAMNPVLLKPEADHRSQVVLNGKAVGSLSSQEWRHKKPEMWDAVATGLDGLRSEYDVVVIEGAGSPAEVNLRASDITNMKVARYAKSPVLLVGDIDRGGVFAALLGTLELLEPEERDLVRGLIINRFRGDRSVLEPLPTMIEERTGKPVLGVVPYFRTIALPEEDAVALENRETRQANDDDLVVAIVRFPRVSNFDDFDPLERTPGVHVRFVDGANGLSGAHLIILPGTKSTISDLRWMRERGLDTTVIDAANRGTPVIGICGGYQMLGESIIDTEGLDGVAGGSEAGLGLLPVQTTFESVKSTRQVQFKMNGGPGLLDGASGIEGAGYEIHMGVTSPVEGACPQATQYVRHGGDLERSGAVNAGGMVLGTYVHGLFDSGSVRAAILGNVASSAGRDARATGDDYSLDVELDKLADHLRENLDMATIYGMFGR